MSRRAWTYIWIVFVMTALLLGAAIVTASPSSFSDQWQLAVVLTISATLAQLFKVEAPNNQTYFATTIFLFAGVFRGKYLANFPERMGFYRTPAAAHDLWHDATRIQDEAERRRLSRFTFRLVHLADIWAVTAGA